MDNNTDILETLDDTSRNDTNPNKTQKQDVLEHILGIHGVDLTQFEQDIDFLNNAYLEKTKKETPEEKLLEKRATDLYNKYLEEKNDIYIEKDVNLESITNSINSDKIKYIKEAFDEPINKLFEHYIFFDERTKNFIKLGVANCLLKSPVSKIAESTLGSIYSFFNDIPKDLDALLDFEKKPKDSGRTLSMKEEFLKELDLYTQKFEEIKTRFENEKITDEQTQMNILSNVDFFRNPELIETKIHEFDVKEIDFTKTQKNETPLDGKSLKEYMVKSREKILVLSKKMDLGDDVGNIIYKMLDKGGSIGSGTKEVVKLILDFPILGKLFAIFLGLDPNNPMEELEENSKNFRFFSSFKKLGVSKDENGNTVEGKEPFKNIDLSGISFNFLKEEIKFVKSRFPNLEEGNYEEFWQKVFSKEGYTNKDGELQIKIEEKYLQDNKIENLEFKKILKNGIKKFRKSKSSKDSTNVPETGQAPDTQDEKINVPEDQQTPAPKITPLEKKASKISQIIKSISAKTKLTDGIDIGNGEKITFDVEKQLLKIGKDNYSLKLKNGGKKYDLDNIIINGEKVIFDAKSGSTTAEIIGYDKKEVSKAIVVEGLKELIKTGKYTYDKNGTKLTFKSFKKFQKS